MAQITIPSKQAQATTTAAKRWWRGRQWRLSSFMLWGSGLFVAGLMLLVPFYLLVRTAEAGSTALEMVLTAKNAATWGRTIWLCVAVTVTSVAISVPLAWLIERTDIPWRRFWGATAALPLVIPSYVFAYLFVSMFGPRGMLQGWLEPVGVQRLPDLYGFWGAWIVLTLISYPYVYLSVRVGIARLDPALLEAGRTLGLNNRQLLWRVILPQLRPSITAGSLLVALYTLRDFGAVMLLRYSTFTRAIYVQYQSFFSRSFAAALALQLILITGVILYIDWRTRGRARYERLSVGVARQAPRTQLGIWRWVAFAYVAFIVGISLVGPAFSLAHWLGRGLYQDIGVRAVAGMVNVSNPWALWQPAVNSLTASGLAAILTVCIAIPVAILVVRRRSRWAALFEQLTYSGLALPGIVIALAMVYFGANYMPALYQTLPLLLVSYIVLFIPQAVGAVRASLLQLPPHVEEAARSLGEHSSGVFRRVTLPLVSPGILAGGALVFLTCMKELPATLILSPTGFDTLSAAVWTNISEAFFAQAALPTLLLILLSSVPLAFLNGRR